MSKKCAICVGWYGQQTHQKNKTNTIILSYNIRKTSMFLETNKTVYYIYKMF